MAATDNFASFALSLDSPFRHVEAVTPHDTNQLTVTSRGLWIGVGGDIAVLAVDGSTATFKNLPTGYLLPGCFNRINSTNTTATNMVAVS